MYLMGVGACFEVKWERASRSSPRGVAMSWSALGLGGEEVAGINILVKEIIMWFFIARPNLFMDSF